MFIKNLISAPPAPAPQHWFLILQCWANMSLLPPDLSVEASSSAVSYLLFREAASNHLTYSTGTYILKRMSLTSSLADHFDPDPDPECEKLVLNPGETLIRMWIQAKTIRIRIQAKTIRIRIQGNCTDSTNPDRSVSDPYLFIEPGSGSGQKSQSESGSRSRQIFLTD